MGRIVESVYAVAMAAGITGTSEELAREQFRVLARQVPIMCGVVIVNSLFLAFAVTAEVGALTAFSFPLFVLPFLIWRTHLWQKRSGSTETENIENIRRALNDNITGAAGSSFVLAIWAVIILHDVPSEFWGSILLFSILSMITCAYCLMALPAATYVVLAIGTICIGGSLWSLGDPMLQAMSLNTALISVLLVYMTSNQFAQLSRLVDSRRKLDVQRMYADKLARHDYLTGMPNRRAFLEALDETAQLRAGLPVAVVMIDMNGFKPINDTYGHAVGDGLLSAVGQSLVSVVNDRGVVARLGGDEFAVLFPEPKSVSEIEKITQLMLLEISKPVIIDMKEIRVGAAFGIAYCPTMPDDTMELVKHADIALYEAKNRKTSTICIFEGDMENRVRRRTLIEQALSDPDQMHGITLYFQPIFSLKNCEHIGFEALARWQHPILGEIPPFEFVRVAESAGLATKMTIHLFKQALLTARLWPDHIRLSFNLSGSGLGTSNLDNILPEILSEMQFDPKRLSVEITETALLNNPVTAQAILSKIQALGVRIILDDFGAGYASVGYLREMNFDGIKLDGSLIASITHNDKSRNLLIGVLHLCLAINAEVTAEMVESEDQLALLRTLPIANVQGFLLGRPVPSGETHVADDSKHIARKQLFS